MGDGTKTVSSGKYTVVVFDSFMDAMHHTTSTHRTSYHFDSIEAAIGFLTMVVSECGKSVVFGKDR